MLGWRGKIYGSGDVNYVVWNRNFFSTPKKNDKPWQGSEESVNQNSSLLRRSTPPAQQGLLFFLPASWMWSSSCFIVVFYLCTVAMSTYPANMQLCCGKLPLLIVITTLKSVLLLLGGGGGGGGVVCVAYLVCTCLKLSICSTDFWYLWHNTDKQEWRVIRGDNGRSLHIVL